MAGIGADISYDDIPDDDQIDEGFEQGDCSSSHIPGDDISLTPLQRIRRYTESDDVLERHWVPRVVQDIFRTAPADVLTKELPDIMKTVTKAEEESLLTLELLKLLPNIALQAIENSKRVEALKDVIGDYLIPLVVRNIGCSDAMIDKQAQATLIQMIERGYINKFQAEIKICPAILALTKMESQLDVNNGAITLMSKLAPLLGRDITERILLKRFTELCSTHLFYVRKLSVSHFGHYCAVVGKEAFEKTLLPCYLTLCQDHDWGVRKACAEVIMYVSCVCPSVLRRTLLADAFAELLQDECKWVRLCAFQTLGAFISTFADPPLTSIGYNDEGQLVMFSQNGSEFHPGGAGGFYGPGLTFKEELRPISLTELYSRDFTEDENEYLRDLLEDENEVTDLDDGEPNAHNTLSENTIDAAKEPLNTEEKVTSQNESLNNICRKRELPVQELSLKTVEVADSKSGIQMGVELPHSIKGGSAGDGKHEDDLLSYNQYNYWYITPSDVDPEALVDISGSYGENLCESSCEDIVTNHLEGLYATISLNDTSNSDDKHNESIKPSGDNKGDNLDSKRSDVSNVNNSSISIEAIKDPPQKIVPQGLIDSFVSMANTDTTFNGNDMSLDCAYSLPAVVLTLGKENWPLLKDTMDTLAAHFSYKIRRSVASSLHEIASILGQEIATEHISPLFEGFLKDLDEVRIGILNNLFDFLQLISSEKRAMFLPKLCEFLRVDNVCNWRFQEKLAEQLTKCVKLFKPGDVTKHIGIFAQALMLHNVAAVRQAAILLVTEIVRHISIENLLTSSYLSVIAERFAHSKKWKPRQTFALLCTEMLRQEVMESEQFATVMLPHLLDLSWDVVANVRLVVGKCIVKQLITKDYFIDPENEQIELLTNVLKRLETDKDRDVRMSADIPFAY